MSECKVSEENKSLTRLAVDRNNPWFTDIDVKYNNPNWGFWIRQGALDVKILSVRVWYYAKEHWKWVLAAS